MQLNEVCVRAVRVWVGVRVCAWVYVGVRVCGCVCASGNADRTATVRMIVGREGISTAKMCAKDRTAYRGSAMIPGSHDTQHSTVCGQSAPHDGQ